jgi:hypothetical protein
MDKKYTYVYGYKKHDVEATLAGKINKVREDFL